MVQSLGIPHPQEDERGCIRNGLQAQGGGDRLHIGVELNGTTKVQEHKQGSGRCRQGR